MRISDWSSDVCSSDLAPEAGAGRSEQPSLRAGVGVRDDGVVDVLGEAGAVRLERGGEALVADVHLRECAVEFRGAVVEPAADVLPVFLGGCHRSFRGCRDAEIGRAHVELQSLMRISYA